MNVECIIVEGNLLPKRYISSGYTAETKFALRLGNIYEVYATSVWRSIVSILVVDEDELPTWYPAEIFRVVDGKVPSNWFFKQYHDNECGLQAIWGPESIVKNDEFYDVLNDRDPSALHYFRTNFLQRSSLGLEQ